MGRAVEIANPAPGTPPAAADDAASAAAAPALPATPAVVTPRSDGLVNLAVTAIRPNPHQPRQQFDQAALQRLADSIKAEGVMQPVIVRPGGAPDAYELVAGERRWRASQLAGLTHIPAIIRNLDDRQHAEWALVENLQREDLNPIERAEAFQHLLTTFKLGHEDVAARVGVDRATVTNTLRLLNLCEEVRTLVREGLISGGQAKVLAGVVGAQDQRTLAQQTVKQDWSVRQLEQTARLIAAGRPAAEAEPAKPKGNAPHLADLEAQIGRTLGTKARIRTGRKKGTGSLTIDFYTIDQFDALLAKLGVEPE